MLPNIWLRCWSSTRICRSFCCLIHSNCCLTCSNASFTYILKILIGKNTSLIVIVWKSDPYLIHFHLCTNGHISHWKKFINAFGFINTKRVKNSVPLKTFISPKHVTNNWSIWFDLLVLTVNVVGQTNY